MRAARRTSQGVTADRAIGVIDSRETNLTNCRLFLVQITRVRDGIELIVNDQNRVANALHHYSGGQGGFDLLVR